MWWLFHILHLAEERPYGNPYHRNRVTCFPRASVNCAPLRSPSPAGRLMSASVFACLPVWGRRLPSVLCELWCGCPMQSLPAGEETAAEENFAAAPRNDRRDCGGRGSHFAALSSLSMNKSSRNLFVLEQIPAVFRRSKQSGKIRFGDNGICILYSCKNIILQYCSNVNTTCLLYVKISLINKTGGYE